MEKIVVVLRMQQLNLLQRSNLGQTDYFSRSVDSHTVDGLGATFVELVGTFELAANFRSSAGQLCVVGCSGVAVVQSYGLRLTSG